MEQHCAAFLFVIQFFYGFFIHYTVISFPQNFIGVMDSGVGGLSVLKILQEKCPQCDFVYIADHAFCPYGTKSLTDIHSRVLKVATFLKNSGAKALALACNTASVFAAQLRERLQLPVFDCIYPTCAEILRATKTKKVALLATNATVKSQAYQKTLGRLGISVLPLCCSSFVPLVENEFFVDCQRQVTNTLQPLKNIDFDTVILGCTHFPFLEKEIKSALPNKNIVSSSFALANCFANCRAKFLGQGKVSCFTTGKVKAANSISEKLGYAFSFVEIQ